MSLTHRLLPAAVAASTAAAVWAARRHPLLQPERWDRVNHRGATLSLLEGPAWAAGATAGALLAPGVDPRARAAAAIVTGGAALFGGIDDHAESGSSKGLKGHLGALRQGKVTTGALKIAGIGAAGLLGAAVATPAPGGRTLTWAGEVAVSGLLIAAGANLGNLLDLRPGRVLKTTLLAAPAVVAAAPVGQLAAAATGAGLTLLPADLAEQGMLGDCGANAVGALLSLELVLGSHRCARGATVRAAALAGLAGLTLLSEKVSFTRIIEATPVLREWDAWGRLPRDAPA